MKIFNSKKADWFFGTGNKRVGYYISPFPIVIFLFCVVAFYLITGIIKAIILALFFSTFFLAIDFYNAKKKYEKEVLEGLNENKKT